MNWRRGLFRLWALFAVLWITVAGSLGFFQFREQLWREPGDVAVGEAHNNVPSKSALAEGEETNPYARFGPPSPCAGKKFIPLSDPCLALPRDNPPSKLAPAADDGQQEPRRFTFDELSGDGPSKITPATPSSGEPKNFFAQFDSPGPVSAPGGNPLLGPEFDPPSKLKTHFQTDHAPIYGYFGFVLAVPLGFLLLGAGVYWVAAGFRQR